MNTPPRPEPTVDRRDFLKYALTTTAGAAAFASTLGGLRVAQASLAASPFAYTDYRALVVVFLYGGNDAFNMLVPTDATGYGDYSTARQGLAIPQASLLPITPLTTPAGPYSSYGLHPSCAGLQARFSAGDLALIAGCGTLAQPTTRLQIQGATATLPAGLFSHTSQADLWQSITPGADGWAGRIAGPLQTAITGAGQTQNFNLNLSLAGTNLLQTGPTTTPFSLSPNGVVNLSGLNTSTAATTRRLQALNSLLTNAQTARPLIQEYGAVLERARDSTPAIEAALTALPALATTFPATSLGRQLEQVARLIAIRGTIGNQRQIFFVGMHGFDTHSNQLTRHANALTELSQALNAFYLATTELALQDSVVTLTQSEFGRALAINGDGTDNGWSGHSLVMGGCVNGQEIYGTPPRLRLDADDDSGDAGRLIPTTPVDAIGATACNWFGVTGMTAGTVGGGSELDNAFPNLLAGGFPAGSHDLGFMA